MKKAKNNYGYIALIFLTSLLLGGCATSIVKQPEAAQVKRVAILSLYADERVPEAKGRGVVTNWNDTVRLQVAEDALNTFQREFYKLGWQVVPPTSVLQSQAYQKTFSIPEEAANTTGVKIASFLLENYRSRYFTPAGMMPIPLQGSGNSAQLFGSTPQKPSDQLALGQMAKQLGVDAVVLVQLDYCYQGGTFSLLGSGEAIMTAGSSIKAVNRTGDLVVNMPTVERCGGDRGESTSSAVMLNGNLQFTSIDKRRFRSMFIEATRQSASLSVAKLSEALRN